MNKNDTSEKIENYIKSLTSDVEFDEYSTTDKISFITNLIGDMQNMVSKYQSEFLKSHVMDGDEVIDLLNEKSLEILENEFGIKHITPKALYYFLLLMTNSRVCNSRYHNNYSFICGRNINETIQTISETTKTFKNFNSLIFHINMVLKEIDGLDNLGDVLCGLFRKFNCEFETILRKLNISSTKCFFDTTYSVNHGTIRIDGEYKRHIIYEAVMDNYLKTYSGFSRRKNTKVIKSTSTIYISEDNNLVGCYIKADKYD